MFKGTRLENLIKRYLRARNMYVSRDIEVLEMYFLNHIEEIEGVAKEESEREKIEAIVMDLLKREKIVKGK